MRGRASPIGMQAEENLSSNRYNKITFYPRMKKKHITVAVALVAALFCSSCAVTPAGYYAPYGTLSVATNGYNTSVAWTSASYDANGFPIFGYSYGRPVYGYTAAGVAIFSIAALTALCYVPRWKPAPWYHGHHHHPPHCHYVAAPPRHPHGHAPAVRPVGGVNAPIHRHPQAALRPHAKPAPHHPLRPNMGAVNRPGHPAARPNMGQANRPGHPAARPNMDLMNRPGSNGMRPRPRVFRPNAGGMNGPGPQSRPVNLGSMSRPGSSGLSRPSAAVRRPVQVNRPTSSMGSMGRPAAGFSRPIGGGRSHGGFSRPSGGMSRPHGGGGHGHRR